MNNLRVVFGRIAGTGEACRWAIGQRLRRMKLSAAASAASKLVKRGHILHTDKRIPAAQTGELSIIPDPDRLIAFPREC
ncbi:MAG TPA: hypothetical protein VNH22_04175 [Blastocatellia bacterium]|nr:hypothetical protein [Blastocatellia bacterium]